MPVDGVKESELKAQYERWAADALVHALDLNFTFERHGNDLNEPDIIYKTDSHSLGIEVTTAYYSDDQASAAWDNATHLGDVLEGFRKSVGTIDQPDELICSRVQKVINDKAAKEYVGTIENWLCIVEQAPLTDKNHLNVCMEGLQIPPNDFEAIYILHRDQTKDHYYAIKIA